MLVTERITLPPLKLRPHADLVQPDGYPLEQHFVTTEDGYILRIYRIPYGRPGSQGHKPATDQDAAPKPVVLLQHGLLCSCAEFLYQGPGKSLAQILADAGEAVAHPLQPACCMHVSHLCTCAHMPMSSCSSILKQCPDHQLTALTSLLLSTHLAPDNTACCRL
jgi:hypothetical protein